MPPLVVFKTVPLEPHTQPLNESVKQIDFKESVTVEFCCTQHDCENRLAEKTNKNIKTETSFFPATGDFRGKPK